MNLDEFKKRQRSRKKEIKKTIGQLKRLKPKVLDLAVQDAHEQAFKAINCLDCANCCKTTGPLFTKSDVERISKHLRLKAAEFEDKYLFRDEDQDLVFKSMPCPFLGQDNYCSIYEVRPKACREYPHTDRDKQHSILHLTEKNAAICPAVDHILQRMEELIVGQ